MRKTPFNFLSTKSISTVQFCFLYVDNKLSFIMNTFRSAVKRACSAI